MKILITGARSYVAYSLVKLTKLQSFTVIAGDCQNKALCFKSKKIDSKIIFPAPNKNFTTFKSFILNYIKKEKINIIFPTCEEVFYFSMIKNDIEKLGVRIFCDEIETLKKLHSKIDCMNLVQGLGIQVPKTKKIEDIEGLQKYKNLSEKYIFKYEFSRFASNIFVNFENKHFINIKNIQEIKGTLLAQEFIEGEKYCSFGVAKKGKLISNIIYKSDLEYKGGSATAFKNVQNTEIDSFVGNLVQKINFNGFISFDYIIGKKGIFVIECNPRITSGIHLFDENKNFSDILFKNKENNYFFPKTEKYITLLLPNLFFNTGKYFSKKKAFSYKNEVFRGEKKLFFYQIFLLLYYIFLSKKYSKTISEISTDGIEYNS